MIFLRLFYEFFKVGLFSVGGGLATLPFLRHLGEVTGWFSAADLANMVAVSESTPGAMGINMATYVGFTVAGIPGAVSYTHLDVYKRQDMIDPAAAICLTPQIL